MTKPEVRRLEQYVPISREELRKRFLERFADPAFDDVGEELERVFARVWNGYIEYRKSPRTKPASEVDGQWEDPAYGLALDWVAAREAIGRAQAEHGDAQKAPHVLLVNGSTRSEHSCPGEVSKTRRLAYAARDALVDEGATVDFLDLSELAAEPWKVIHPCKACVSTSMPLCHWPCSCYPNYALGQTSDWMNDIYPRWVRAHGVMILCPVHWYHAPASLKLMIDRLVCADGGNPDPTSTSGKDPAKAKALELAGWHYPKHLAGRAFAVVAHGDTDGVGGLRQTLSAWLTDIGLVRAGASGELGRYVGYYDAYATSHEALDADEAIFAEVAVSARALVRMTAQLRSGGYRPPDADLESPREK